MEHGTQLAGVQRLRHLVFRFEMLDGMVIELGRTIQIVLEGGGGKDAVADGLDVLRLLPDFVALRRQFHSRRRDETLQRHAEVVLQLLDIPALLPCLEALRTAVVQKPDMLRPLDHAVEIVGPYAVLILEGRQAEALAEFRRDEGCAARAARESTFVRRQDHQVPEIQGTRFQRAHHLEPFQRLAPERDGLAGEELVQQMQPGGGQHVQADAVEQIDTLEIALGEVQFQQHRLHAAEFPAHVTHDVREVGGEGPVPGGVGLLGLQDHGAEHQVQERPALEVLLRDVVFRVLLDLLDDLLLLRRQDRAEEAVGEDGTDLAVVEIPAARLLPQALLHRGDGGHQGVNRPARQGAAHGDIDAAVFRRDRVQQGHQEVLVRKDEGGFHRVVHVAAPEDFRGQFRLAGGGRDADHMESGHADAGGIDLESVRELADIVPHEEGGLVPGVADGIGHIVPGELGDAGVPHLAEDRPLALVQGVQAHENVFLDLREDIGQHLRDGVAPFQAGGQAPVHHAFIGHSPLPEPLAELDIQRIKDVPDLEEARLDGLVVRVQMHGQTAVVVAEMADEVAHGLPLDLRQVAVVVLDALEVRHVGEKVLRVHEELVHVVEVGEDDLAPEEELVQGLRLGIDGLVRLVQFQQQLNALRDLAVMDTIKEVVDGQ